MTAQLIKRLSLLVVVSLLTGWGSWAQSAQIASMKQPVHGIPTKQKAAQLAAQTSSTNQQTTQTGTANNGIQFSGGPVLNKPTGVNVYFIWYGDWSSNPGAKEILTELSQRVGGSPYFNINTTYYDYDKGGQQDPVFNKVNYLASVYDHYSRGANLSDIDVYYVVINNTGPGTPLPIDTNGVYFVLTSPDVTEQEFGTVFCAWHNNIGVEYFALPGQIFDIKVAFVGDPHNYFSICGAQNPSPNNNPDADSMATFVTHELEESVTDPDGNAWINSDGSENADLCVWTFGMTKPLPNGSSYNMHLGNRPYMIQQNWVNAKGDYCALSWEGE